MKAVLVLLILGFVALTSAAAPNCNTLCNTKSKAYKDCGAESCKLDVVKDYKANKGSCRCDYMDCEVYCQNVAGQYNGCSGGEQQTCRKNVIDSYKKHKASCDCAFMAGRVA